MERRRSASPDPVLYTERLSSPRTLGLFLLLTLVFGVPGILRSVRAQMDGWTAAAWFFAAVFLFYSINYRTLVIRLTGKGLMLKFGIFTWRVPVTNIAGCRLDCLPALKRLGGAGIHFMSVNRRYRASFNFLEYPRVVVELKQKAGPVREISFSTCRPDQIIALIEKISGPA